VKDPGNLVCMARRFRRTSTSLSSPAKKGMDRPYTILERQRESGVRARAYAREGFTRILCTPD
jgi:hypothetical protein